MKIITVMVVSLMLMSLVSCQEESLESEAIHSVVAELNTEENTLVFLDRNGEGMDRKIVDLVQDFEDEFNVRINKYILANKKIQYDSSWVLVPPNNNSKAVLEERKACCLLMKRKDSDEFNCLANNYNLESLSRWMFLAFFSQDEYWSRVFDADLMEYFREEDLKETLGELLLSGGSKYVFLLPEMEGNCSGEKTFSRIDEVRRVYYEHEFIVILGDTFSREDCEAISFNFNVQTEIISPADRLVKSIKAFRKHCNGKSFPIVFIFDENSGFTEATVFETFDEMMGYFL